MDAVTITIHSSPEDSVKLHRINALVARHLYLYRRSLPRIMEIFYWPFLDLVIWGFHHAVSDQVSASGARLRHLFSRRADSLGHAVSIATRDHYFLPGGTVGQKFDEFICQPPDAGEFLARRSP